MDKAIVYGQALTQLRARARLSQDRAAEAAGVSQPTWGRYESGESRAFFERLSVREKILSALGFTIKDLEAEVAGLNGGASSAGADKRFSLVSDVAPSFETQGFGLFEVAAPDQVDLSRLMGPNARFIRIVSDDIAPYVQAGGFAVYDTKGFPRRNDGVIVKLRSGAYLPRIFVRQGGGHVELSRFEVTEVDGVPTYRAVGEAVPIFDIEGVYPITIRGDHI